MRSKWRWLVVLFVLTTALALGIIASRPGPAAPLAELKDIEDLRARFNQDQGAPRLILLLSPT